MIDITQLAKAYWPVVFERQARKGMATYGKQLTDETPINPFESAAEELVDAFVYLNRLETDRCLAGERIVELIDCLSALRRGLMTDPYQSPSRLIAQIDAVLAKRPTTIMSSEKELTG